MRDDAPTRGEPLGKFDLRAGRDRRLIFPIVGAWLIASPFLFRYARAPQGVNELICGSVLLMLGALSSSQPSRMPFEPSVIVGGWLCFAPFIFAGAIAISVVTDLLCGFVVVALSTRPMDPAYWRTYHSDDRRGGRKKSHRNQSPHPDK